MVHAYLLRGLARRKEHWQSFPDKLLASNCVTNVRLIDIPNQNVLKEADLKYTMENIANFLQQKIYSPTYESERRIFIGLSLGALIGLEWLTQYPGTFEKAFMINMSLPKVNRFYHRLTWQGMARLLDIALTQELVTRELKVLNMTTENHQGNLELATTMAEIEESYSYNTSSKIDRTTLLFQLCAAFKYQPPIEKIKQLKNIVLIASKKDKLVNYISSQQISEIFGFPLITNESAGHDLPLDATNWLVKEIKHGIT